MITNDSMGNHRDKTRHPRYVLLKIYCLISLASQLLFVAIVLFQIADRIGIVDGEFFYEQFDSYERSDRLHSRTTSQTACDIALSAVRDELEFEVHDNIQLLDETVSVDLLRYSPDDGAIGYGDWIVSGIILIEIGTDSDDTHFGVLCFEVVVQDFDGKVESLDFSSPAFLADYF